ncbi:MAG: CotH kinase family protein [Verrucomicrobiota bacterium]
MLGIALAIIAIVARGDTPTRKASQKPPPGEDLFIEGYIPALRIEIPEAGVTSLRRSARRYVRATVKEGTIVYTNVAIHLKGGPGSFRQLDDYPAFTLNFDRFSDGQKFHGLKKIHLNNSVQDRTFLAEKISRELFEAAGVPAPRAGNAKVDFNGHGLGLYVLVEGVNKQFLRRYFKDTTGNVYDGHSQSDVTRNLPTNSGESPADQTRLRALAAAVRETDLKTRLASLEKTLDLDRFISFIAMEAMLWHWDGYVMNRNNFRIYHDRDSNRMVFLPHGLDQILTKPDGPIFPQTAGLVARSVLEIPDCQRRYRERMAQLLTNVFNVVAITNHIHQVADKIEIALSETDPQSAAAYHQRVLRFCRRLQQRVHSIARQLSPVLAENPSQFDNAGIMTVGEWQPKIDLGNPSLTQDHEKGRTLLHISTQDHCAASWRSNARLDSGQYRLVARMKTEGVVLGTEDQKAGVGLRISRHKFGQKIPGDKEWTLVGFDFDVQQDQSDVELVCELRAVRGDVWFDLKSLKLIRR